MNAQCTQCGMSPRRCPGVFVPIAGWLLLMRSIGNRPRRASEEFHAWRIWRVDVRSDCGADSDHRGNSALPHGAGRAPGSADDSCRHPCAPHRAPDRARGTCSQMSFVCHADDHSRRQQAALLSELRKGIRGRRAPGGESCVKAGGRARGYRRTGAIAAPRPGERSPFHPCDHPSDGDLSPGTAVNRKDGARR